MLEQLKSLFDLRHDQDDSETIDRAIRAGTRIGGTNLWVLIFAILIASVGLNVNSTAVVIGAMLISPLMGPLLALGYGAGISDYRLIRSAARGLAIFVALSLLTSSVYREDSGRMVRPIAIGMLPFSRPYDSFVGHVCTVPNGALAASGVSLNHGQRTAMGTVKEQLYE